MVLTNAPDLFKARDDQPAKTAQLGPHVVLQTFAVFCLLLRGYRGFFFVGDIVR